MKKHHWAFIIGIIWLGMGLVRCNPKQSLLLQNTVCQLPCWQNIQPGITTSEETLDILKVLPYLASQPGEAPIKFDEVRSYNSWVFTNDWKETSGRATYVNNIVAEIEFNINGSTFGELVDYYGEPEYISVVSGWADSRWLSVSLLYPSQGVLIHHFDFYWRPSDDVARITSKLTVSEVIYFDPNLYDQLVDVQFFGTVDLITVPENFLHWTGFGEYPYVD